MFYLYDVYGDQLPLTTILKKEGADCFTTIQDEDSKVLYDGITKKLELEEWKQAIKPEDIVVFGYNTEQAVETYKELTARGISNIVNGSDFAFNLEINRILAMKLLTAAGIKIPETFAFTKNQEALDFLKENEGKWVYKPCDEASGSDDTQIAETSEEMGIYIESRPDMEFILQRFIVDGICEVGVEIYFSKGTPIAVAHCIETKRFLSGDWGGNTGCMSSVTWFDGSIENNPTIDQTWGKLFPYFKKLGVTGTYDLSGIVDKSGNFWALEFTPGRWGYSQEWALWQLVKMPISTMLEGMAKGTLKSIDCLYDQYGTCARGSLAPYPLEGKINKDDPDKDTQAERKKLVGLTAGKPIILKRHDDITYNFVDVKSDEEGNLITAGVDLIVCELSTKDKDIMKAQERTIAAFKDIKLSGLQIRSDMFQDAFKQIPQLKEVKFWGSKSL